MIKKINYCIRKIGEGFLEHIGVMIAVAMASFIGTFYGGRNESKTVVEELSKHDSTIIDELSKRDFSFKVNKDRNLDLAKKYELAGFQALLDKDINEAIGNFTQSENSANGFHASYEIANYLRHNKKSALKPDFWEHTYRFVITNYRGYLPLECLREMEKSLRMEMTITGQRTVP